MISRAKRAKIATHHIRCIFNPADPERWRPNCVTAEQLKEKLPWGCIDLNSKDAAYGEAKSHWLGVWIPQSTFSLSYWGRITSKQAQENGAAWLSQESSRCQKDFEDGCANVYRSIAEQFTTETDFQDFSHCMTPSLSLFLNDQLEPWRSAGDEIKVEVESVQANLKHCIVSAYTMDPDWSWRSWLGDHSDFFWSFGCVQKLHDYPLRLNVHVSFLARERFIINGIPQSDFKDVKHTWTFQGLYQAFSNDLNDNEESRNLYIGNMNWVLDNRPILMKEPQLTTTMTQLLADATKKA